MAIPANLDEQLAAAKVLADLIKADVDEHLDDTEKAFSAVLCGVKRLINVAIMDELEGLERAIALAHVVGFLGEIVGATCKALPPEVQSVAMKMFANELNTAFGEARATTHDLNLAEHMPAITPKERLH